MDENARKNGLPHEVFCDASFLVAYFAPADSHHEKATRMSQRLQGFVDRLYTSWHMVSEALTLLLYHNGYSSAMALIDGLPMFRLVLPTEADYQKAVSLFARFNKDQKFSLNDVLTCTLLQTSLRKMPILTFDSDFKKMGLTVFRL